MRFSVALEITPPRQSLKRVLARRAQLLGPCATAINVIQRADRQPSLEASIELVQAGLQPVWHLAQRGSSRDGLRLSIAQAAAGGVSQVLCVRGDHEAEDTADTPTIRETVAMVAEAIPGAVIGATLNQYSPDAAAALKNLFPKLSAGATYVQTQPVFDLAKLLPYAEAVLEKRPEARIVPMVMPMLSSETAARIEQLLGTALPESVVGHTSDEALAWAAFTRTIADLVTSPLIHGIAIMTVMEASAETGSRIQKALHEAGVPCPHLS